MAIQLDRLFAAEWKTKLESYLPGYFADLIVVETDPFTCDPSALFNIQPTATMVGGEWVWQS